MSVALALLIAVSSSSPSSPPSASRGLPPANAFARRYDEAIVVVRHDDDGPGPHAAREQQGFFVSSTGVLCTVLHGAAIDDLVDVVGAAPMQGRVVAVDDDGLALVQVVVDEATPVTALGLSRDGRFTPWLVGLAREARGVSAVIGGEERSGLLVPVPRGAPVLDDNGAVVAIATRNRGGGAVAALPVARLQALATRWRTTTTTTTPTATTKQAAHR